MVIQLCHHIHEKLSEYPVVISAQVWAVYSFNSRLFLLLDIWFVFSMIHRSSLSIISKITWSEVEVTPCTGVTSSSSIEHTTYTSGINTDTLC